MEHTWITHGSSDDALELNWWLGRISSAQQVLFPTLMNTSILTVCYTVSQVSKLPCHKVVVLTVYCPTLFHGVGSLSF